MLDAYIYEGLRTPFGRYAGSLAKIRPDDLMASAIRSVMAVTKFKAEQIEDIVTLVCPLICRLRFRVRFCSAIAPVVSVPSSMRRIH